MQIAVQTGSRSFFASSSAACWVSLSLVLAKWRANIQSEGKWTHVWAREVLCAEAAASGLRLGVQLQRFCLTWAKRPTSAFTFPLGVYCTFYADKILVHHSVYEFRLRSDQSSFQH